jgi:hypothetical protein
LQRWRLACLGIGFVLIFLSPIVSKWAPFYYSSSMSLGILLVVLIVLFQVCFLEHIFVEDFIVADLADMTIIETIGI